MLMVLTSSRTVERATSSWRSPAPSTAGAVAFLDISSEDHPAPADFGGRFSRRS
jgi:hypothetical protein